jgi:uncharacterized damage-inducible protein DinB
MRLEKLQYPIGQFEVMEKNDNIIVKKWIKDIKQTPVLLKVMVSNLDNVQLDTRYRKGGWTVRQVVHHLADSHMNSYIRFKLALTEDRPVIKPYFEEKWAELPDSRQPIAMSLSLLEALHERWSVLLESLSDDELERTFIHPESGEMKLRNAIGLYSWHGRHHMAQIAALCRKNGWVEDEELPVLT